MNNYGSCIQSGLLGSRPDQCFMGTKMPAQCTGAEDLVRKWLYSRCAEIQSPMRKKGAPLVSKPSADSGQRMDKACRPLTK